MSGESVAAAIAAWTDSVNDLMATASLASADATLWTSVMVTVDVTVDEAVAEAISVRMAVTVVVDVIVCVLPPTMANVEPSQDSVTLWMGS